MSAILLKKLLMPFKSIIFDFNGLIVDDEPIHFELFRQVLADEGIELKEKDYWETYVGYDDKGLFEVLYQNNNKKLSPKKLKELIHKKNQLYLPTMKNKMKLFPGVKEFIEEMKNQYILAIVSGALLSEIELVLNLSGLKKAFQIIVSAENAKKGKPDPQGFLLCLERLKKIDPTIGAKDCLVLEDSLAGVQAAHAAQMKVIALTHTYRENELQKAHFIAKNFFEVRNILRKI